MFTIIRIHNMYAATPPRELLVSFFFRSVVPYSYAHTVYPNSDITTQTLQRYEIYIFPSINFTGGKSWCLWVIESEKYININHATEIDNTNFRWCWYLNKISFFNTPKIESKQYQRAKSYTVYLQWTCNLILLLTEGGTEFDAIHKYAPISDRVTLESHSISPSTTSAEKEHFLFISKLKLFR